MANIDYIR